MENKTDILNELQELSPVLAAMEKTNVFTVPEGYFEHLGTDIMMGIKHEKGLGENKVDRVNSDVPAGYFDSLAATIIDKIKAQASEDALTEIRALSPMLYSIQNENVFEIPQGYFENLPDDVILKLKPQPKVITMQRRSSSIMKYAVAAVFTGLMALGVFKFTGNTNNKIDLPDYVTAGLLVQDVDQELTKISDAEIVKFLEASGTDITAAFVANSIDDNELPSQEDYLMDDEALDKYLNSIHVDGLKN